MMEHLFRDLYGVDAPPHWEAYSAPPNPITGNTGLNGRVLRGGEEWRGLWENVAEGEGNRETKREREGGEGNSALVVGGRRLCQ